MARFAFGRDAASKQWGQSLPSVFEAANTAITHANRVRVITEKGNVGYFDPTLPLTRVFADCFGLLRLHPPRDHVVWYGRLGSHLRALDWERATEMIRGLSGRDPVTHFWRRWSYACRNPVRLFQRPASTQLLVDSWVGWSDLRLPPDTTMETIIEAAVEAHLRALLLAFFVTFKGFDPTSTLTQRIVWIRERQYDQDLVRGALACWVFCGLDEIDYATPYLTNDDPGVAWRTCQSARWHDEGRHPWDLLRAQGLEVENQPVIGSLLDPVQTITGDQKDTCTLTMGGREVRGWQDGQEVEINMTPRWGPSPLRVVVESAYGEQPAATPPANVPTVPNALGVGGDEVWSAERTAEVIAAFRALPVEGGWMTLEGWHDIPWELGHACQWEGRSFILTQVVRASEDKQLATLLEWERVPVLPTDTQPAEDETWEVFFTDPTNPTPTHREALQRYLADRRSRQAPGVILPPDVEFQRVRPQEYAYWTTPPTDAIADARPGRLSEAAAARQEADVQRWLRTLQGTGLNPVGRDAPRAELAVQGLQAAGVGEVTIRHLDGQEETVRLIGETPTGLVVDTSSNRSRSEDAGHLVGRQLRGEVPLPFSGTVNMDRATMDLSAENPAFSAELWGLDLEGHWRRVEAAREPVRPLVCTITEFNHVGVSMVLGDDDGPTQEEEGAGGSDPAT